MEYPVYCDTPQWADPLNSWPEWSIVGGESGVFIDDEYYDLTEPRRGMKYESFINMLKNEDEEIATLVMSIIQSRMLDQ